MAGIDESEAPEVNEERRERSAADRREGVQGPRLLTSPQATVDASTLFAYILRWIIVAVVAAALIVLLLRLL